VHRRYTPPAAPPKRNSGNAYHAFDYIGWPGGTVPDRKNQGAMPATHEAMQHRERKRVDEQRSLAHTNEAPSG